MSLSPSGPDIATLADLPSEDIVILAPGTSWRVP
jgi:hypothetical protein